MIILEVTVGVLLGLLIFRKLIGVPEVYVQEKRNPWESEWYIGKD